MEPGLIRTAEKTESESDHGAKERKEGTKEMRKKDIKKRHKVRDNSRDEIRNGKKCNIEK